MCKRTHLCASLLSGSVLGANYLDRIGTAKIQTHCCVELTRTNQCANTPIANALSRRTALAQHAYASRASRKRVVLRECLYVWEAPYNKGPSDTLIPALRIGFLGFFAPGRKKSLRITLSIPRLFRSQAIRGTLAKRGVRPSPQPINDSDRCGSIAQRYYK